MVGVLIRDKYFDEIGIDLEEIDRHDPELREKT
jgi:hypothetical protein